MTTTYLQDSLNEALDDLREKQNETLLVQQHELEEYFEDIYRLRLELSKQVRLPATS